MRVDNKAFFKTINLQINPLCPLFRFLYARIVRDSMLNVLRFAKNALTSGSKDK